MQKEEVFLYIVMLCVLPAPLLALPLHGEDPIQQMTDIFEPGVGIGQASVTSEVYEAIGGGYIYAYQISDATVDFTWFSIAFNPGTTVTSLDYDSTGLDPMDWLLVNTPPTSIEALFDSGLASNTSSLLWFTCTEAPANGVGALAKLSVGGGVYAEGNVLVPVPEPMTIILLSAGWLMLRSCKRKLIFHKKQT